MGMQRWFTGLLMAAILVLLFAFGCILAIVTFGSRVRDWCARTWVDAFLLSARALN
jgi:amino acid transporter